MSTEREQRYAEAYGQGSVADSVRAVMAVADAEQAELRASLGHALVRETALRNAGNEWMRRAERAEAALAEAQAKVTRVEALLPAWRRDGQGVSADADEVLAALAGPERNPCGHSERTDGCGGCDPGAVEYVRDDGDHVWRKVEGGE